MTDSPERKSKVSLDRKDVIDSIDNYVYDVVMDGVLQRNFPELSPGHIENVFINNVRFEKEDSLETTVTCDIHIVFFDSEKPCTSLAARIACGYEANDIRAISTEQAGVQILNIDYC